MRQTALLIRCNADEADRIRFEAKAERSTISAYVLTIMMKAVVADDRRFSERDDLSNEVLNRRLPSTGNRTAVLVRCDEAQAERIRKAARRRDIHINTFVIQTLKNAWKQQVLINVDAPQAPLRTALSS